jgi:hypothetical protein
MCRQQKSCAVLAVLLSANAMAGGSVGLQPVVSHQVVGTPADLYLVEGLK